MLKPFSPVIEDPEYGTFITAQPVDLLKSGNYNQVPLISGVNKDEGDLPYGGKLYIINYAPFWNKKLR